MGETTVLLIVLCVITVADLAAGTAVILWGPSGKTPELLAILIAPFAPIVTSLVALVRSETTRAAVEAHTGQSVAEATQTTPKPTVLKE